MKTDLYTKIVLTVIAIALCAIVFQNANVATPAQAASRPVEIPVPAPIPAVNEVVDVNIVQVNGRRIYGSDLPVKVENRVEIKN